jgi:hypothetical protein
MSPLVLKKRLAVAGQLAASPMMLFAIRIEDALNVTVQRLHDADSREHRWPPNVATRIRASIAACHSALSSTAF